MLRYRLEYRLSPNESVITIDVDADDDAVAATKGVVELCRKGLFSPTIQLVDITIAPESSKNPNEEYQVIYTTLDGDIITDNIQAENIADAMYKCTSTCGYVSIDIASISRPI